MVVQQLLGSGLAGHEPLAEQTQIARNAGPQCDSVSAREEKFAETGLTRGSPRNRQALDAVNELRQQSRWFAGHGDVRDFAAQFVEDDSDLTTSQVGPQTEMRASAAEAQMRVGVARDIKSPRIVEP